MTHAHRWRLHSKAPNKATRFGRYAGHPWVYEKCATCPAKRRVKIDPKFGGK